MLLIYDCQKFKIILKIILEIISIFFIYYGHPNSIWKIILTPGSHSKD